MSKLQDLEILSKYLSQDELKEIAKSAAYDLFRNYIAQDNPNRKSNINHFAVQGAMMAMQEAIEPFKPELMIEYKDKVLAAIKEIDNYTVTLHNDKFIKMVDEAVLSYKDIIQSKANQIMTNYVNNDKEFDSFYDKMVDTIGYSFTEMLHELLENKFKTKPN